MFKDMAGMMKKAQQVQEKMQEAQALFKKEEIIGISGAGLVKLTMNGGYEAKQIEIDDSLLDDKEMLEDLITAAINNATKKIQEKSSDNMQDVTSNILPPGFKIPF